MPFFRKKNQGGQNQAKLELQLYHARHAPDSTIDLSSCDLSRIPDDVYSLCWVLRKEALLLHSNQLKTLKSIKNGYNDFVKLGDILRVLDVHENELTELSSEIGFLSSLQMLNVEGNKLQHLPAELGNLQMLQSLNVRNNRLSFLPDSLKQLISLRSLDISSNSITSLPLWISQLRSLETLIVDSASMKDPPSEVCANGTKAMMQYMCQKAGVAYHPPSKSVLPLLSDLSVAVDRRASTKSVGRTGKREDLSSLAIKYGKERELKQEEQARLSRELLQQQSDQAAFVAQCTLNRCTLLAQLAHDKADIDARISNLQLQKDEERTRLVAVMGQMEDHAKSLISKILEMNRQIKQTEIILEREEKKRIQDDNLLKVKMEEYDRLKRKDVEASMIDIMAQNYSFDQLFNLRIEERNHFAKGVLDQELTKTKDIGVLLEKKDAEMRKLFEQLASSEQLQKRALLSLIETRDARTIRLRGQIGVLQKELTQLSLLELKHRDLKTNNEQSILKNEREQLMRLMMQLIEEKRKRAIELQSRLLEMERCREEGALDYWLVQYQKVLEAKPSGQMQLEDELDPDVSKVLRRSGAANYIPNFARHCIRSEQLPLLTEHQLQTLGMYEMGLRQAVLEQIRLYCSEGNVEERRPSAPAEIAPGLSLAYFEAECCVCMERPVQLLLVPCGHVCVCTDCGLSLTQCPICRNIVEQRINLFACQPSAPPTPP